MGLLTKTLSLKAIDGKAPECRMLSVEGLSSTYVFLRIVDELKNEFHAVATKEAGSAMYDEWLVELTIGNQTVAVMWAWHGITVSVYDKAAHELLGKISDHLSRLKLNKLRLMFEEKMG